MKSILAFMRYLKELSQFGGDKKIQYLKDFFNDLSDDGYYLDIKKYRCSIDNDNAILINIYYTSKQKSYIYEYDFFDTHYLIHKQKTIMISREIIDILKRLHFLKLNPTFITNSPLGKTNPVKITHITFNPSDIPNS